MLSFNVKQYVQVEATIIGSRLGMNYVCTYLREWGEIMHHLLTYVKDSGGHWIDGSYDSLRFTKISIQSMKIYR